MFCGHKLYDFTDANTCFAALPMHCGKNKFVDIKLYKLYLQII